MRKSLLALTTATLVACAPAHAEEVEQESDFNYCSRIAELAETTMKARQRGVPMRNLLDETDNLVFRNIIIWAYEEPMWGTDGRKRQAATEYGNEIHMQCLREE